MVKLKHLYAIAMIMASHPLIADVTYPVDTTDFTGGTPALASEVNTNFGTLVDAINDLNSRVSSLEQKHDGTLCSASTATSGVYKFLLYAGVLTATNAANGNEMETIFEIEKGDLCLRSNNQFQLVIHQDKEARLNSSNSNFFVDSDIDNSTETILGTYSISSGCKLTLSPTGESQLSLHGTPNLQSFFGVSNDQDDLCSSDTYPCPPANVTGEEHYTDLITLVKKGPSGTHRCTP